MSLKVAAVTTPEAPREQGLDVPNTWLVSSTKKGLKGDVPRE